MHQLSRWTKSNPFLGSMYHYVLLAAAVLLAVVGYGVKNRLRRTAKLPPSPPSVPFFGHLHLLGPLLHRSLHELHLRYGTNGGLLLLQLGRRRTLVVSTAAAAADLYRKHDLAFASRPFIAAAHKLSYGSKNISFAPLGDNWRRARKMAVVHVLSPRRVEAFAPVRAAEAAAIVGEIRHAATAAADVGAVELRGLLYSYSNAVVTRAVTGAAGTTAEKLKQLLGNATSLVAGVQADDLLPDMAAKVVRWATGLEKKYDDTIEELDKFMSPIMADHAEKKGENGGAGEEDFMDVLLRLREESTDGFELTDRFDPRRNRDNVVDVGMDHGRARGEPSGDDEAAGRDQSSGRREAVNHGGGGERDGIPEGGGEGGAPAPPPRPDPAPAPVDGGGGRAVLRDPGQDLAPHQRVGDREGPRGVGLAGGVPAGAVLGQPTGGGLQGERLPARPVRRRPEDLPRHQLRRAGAGDGAGRPPAPLRLGASRRHERGGAGHDRGARADHAAARPAPSSPQVQDDACLDTCPGSPCVLPSRRCRASGQSDSDRTTVVCY